MGQGLVLFFLKRTLDNGKFQRTCNGFNGFKPCRAAAAHRGVKQSLNAQLDALRSAVWGCLKEEPGCKDACAAACCTTPRLLLYKAQRECFSLHFVLNVLSAIVHYAQSQKSKLMHHCKYFEVLQLPFKMKLNQSTHFTF